MKIAFYVNAQTPEIPMVGKILQENGYSILRTNIPDEINQAGNQANKLILVFDDAKFAYKFCGENTWAGNFSSLRILFLGRKPIINEEVSRKLRSVGLDLYTLGEEEKLSDKVLQFESDEDAAIDIEFSIISDLKNEPPAPIQVAVTLEKDVPPLKRKKANS